MDRVTSEVVETTIKSGEAPHERRKKVFICKNCRLEVVKFDKYCKHCGKRFF